MKEHTPSLTFSIGTILAVTAVVAVLTALTVRYPGIGVFVIILAAPAAVRTVMINLARRRRGERLSTLAKIAYFASSILITLLVSGSAIVLFVLICVPTSIVVVVPLIKVGQGNDPYALVVFVAVWGMSAAIGLTVATIIARLLWWRTEFSPLPADYTEGEAAETGEADSPEESPFD